MNIKPKKRSGFLTFCASFIPGAAEMYMGFFKSGISILLVFAASIIIPVVFMFSDVFVLVPMLFWLVAFFHARNIVACDDETFAELKDIFFWDEYADTSVFKIKAEVARKWIAVAAILLGICALWSEAVTILNRVLGDEIYHYIAPYIEEVPRVAVAIAVIYIGVKLIQGNKIEDPALMIEDKLSGNEK